MEEIKVKNNPLDIRIFVIGRPDIDHMSEEEYAVFAAALELRIDESLKEIRNDRIIKKQ